MRMLGIAGSGVIGAGWAARALHAGVDVLAYDSNAEQEAHLRAILAHAAPTQEALTAGMPLPARGNLTFTTDMEDLATQADFIQENIPENLAIKREFLTALTARADEHVVIASSTSGFMPSELQQDMRHPQRMLVGHPFNPVYLLPLVEVVAGARTRQSVVDAARAFYRSLGMHPLLVRREVPGHLSDRLQEAIWRESLHAINDGIATTEELDDSIIYGPGLRWAVMGVNQTYMLAGGSGGAEHFLRQFGPALKFPWTHLRAPELSEELARRFVRETGEQCAGRSVRELERLRDECLVAIQGVLRRHDVGAGKALNEFAALLSERAKTQAQKNAKTS